MDQLEKCAKLIKKAKVILIGAGSGLSTSDGFEYSGERFKNYFQDLLITIIFRICMKQDFILTLL